MTQEFFIPDCAMQLLSHVYPNLQFDQVRFFVGIPTFLDKGQPAITQPYLGGQRVYFQSQTDFCDPESFLVFCHELVHAQQIQDLPFPAAFEFNYVYCFITASFSDSQHNCYEEEAYNFANSGSWPGAPEGRLRSILHNTAPCACNPLPTDSTALEGLIERVEEEHVIFRASSCSTNDCFSDLAARIGVIPALLISVIAFVAAVLAFVVSLAGVNTGTLVGLIGGGIGGALAGFGIAGGALGALGLLGGLLGLGLGLILGAVLGALLGSLLQDLFDTLTGGDSGGHLNLVISPDDGASFGKKYTFERSREQMSLSTIESTLPVGGDTLFIGWTGLDAQVNVLATGPTSVQQSFLTQTSFEQSNHCGPAIAWHDPSQQLMVVWVGTEGHLNIIPLTLNITGSNAQLTRGNKTTLTAKSPADATPGLVSANGNLYLAWVEDPTGVIHIWRSQDSGITWDEPTPTSGRTLKTGTSALAYGDGRIYLAWSGTGSTTDILIESFLLDANGIPSFPRDGLVTIGGTQAVSAVKGGPTAAYGDGQLHIGWTDPKQSMHLASSLDQGVTFTVHHTFDPETSRGNAGPALAARSSVLEFGWTGQG